MKGELLVITMEECGVPQAVVTTVESARTWFREHGVTEEPEAQSIGVAVEGRRRPGGPRFCAYWMSLGK